MDIRISEYQGQMEVIHGLKNIKKRHKGYVVGIGTFDGMHIGHQRVIKTAVIKAREINTKCLIITFAPHPEKFLSKKEHTPLLISVNHRIELISNLGVDYCLLINFTRHIAGLEPKEFVQKVLVEKLNIKYLFVGQNFLFGKNAKGNTNLLKGLAERFDFEIDVVKLIRHKDKPISSTLIRSLISRGKLNQAKNFLGRPVSVLGTVVRGDRRGRIIGFPTANINPHHEAIPPSGVYAVLVNYKGKTYKGVLNIGFRPTFEDCRLQIADCRYRKEPRVEVHILDFKKRIYGQAIHIDFVKRIRKERKFADRHRLIERIKKDVHFTKKILCDRI